MSFFYCDVEDCNREFDTEGGLRVHKSRKHKKPSTALAVIPKRKPKQTQAFTELKGFKLLTTDGEDIWIAERVR